MAEDIEVIMEHPAVRELVEELTQLKEKLKVLDDPELLELLKALKKE